MEYVYILKLTDRKFYIGKTNSPLFKLKDFRDNCDWTKRYKPIKVIMLIQNSSVDKYTKLYMELYGINNYFLIIFIRKSVK